MMLVCVCVCFYRGSHFFFLVWRASNGSVLGHMAFVFAFYHAASSPLLLLSRLIIIRIIMRHSYMMCARLWAATTTATNNNNAPKGAICKKWKKFRGPNAEWFWKWSRLPLLTENAKTFAILPLFHWCAFPPTTAMFWPFPPLGHPTLFPFSLFGSASFFCLLGRRAAFPHIRSPCSVASSFLLPPSCYYYYLIYILIIIVVSESEGE